MAKKKKTAFACKECGYNSVKWLGKCPGCHAWNSFVEELKTTKGVASRRAALNPATKPRPISEIGSMDGERLTSNIHEFDRVLGGGFVEGSAVLLAGAPGIGKSTLTLQVCYAIGEKLQRPVLYITGEESSEQIKLRAERLNCVSNAVFVVAETSLDIIRNHIQEMKPALCVIDSVQTLYDSELASAPGSVGQVRECTASVIMQAKSIGMPLIVVGHVTKEGSVAGPRTLEHMVDAVLNFDGEKYQSYRLLRSSKNRFGSTGELGVFEMREEGLVEVDNASQVFLDEYDHSRAGCAIIPAMEGTRVLLVEVQALVAPSPMSSPRRRFTGLDQNRAHMMLAVLEKRAGLRLSTLETYLNVVGGVTVDEPAADLGLCFAATSSAVEAKLPPETVFIGEVGLSGEVRNVRHLQERLDESARLGFKQAVIPKSHGRGLKTPKGMKLVRLANLREGLERFYLVER